ncbi:MAG: LysM peptidoglycan-binding domain-containing protein [Anaerolineae bacterium]|nr:LysM peptidoglycan-binding domain-containing protein [Anaerolineae bacterium]
MSHRRMFWTLAAVCIMAAVWGLPVLASPLAQGSNLLQNPGFEDPFVPYLGDTTRMVATGWSAWHVPQRAGDDGWRNLKPEYQPASAEHPDRILEGSNAQEYFGFFSTHTGGVYQQVNVPAGADLRFSVSIYVWSTNFDDPAVSQDPGRVQVQVGIDPQGGTDGEAERIIWSQPVEYYDEYRPIAVETRAEASRVTVFVRTTFDAPQRHNNVYLDQAALVVTGGPIATFTPTNLPSITPFPTITPLATNTLPAGMATPTQDYFETPGVPTATPDYYDDEFPYYVIYRVNPGDTVGAIALQFDSTIEAIVRANGLGSANLIYVGQDLVVPVRQQPVLTPYPTPLPTQAGILPTPTPFGYYPPPTPTPPPNTGGPTLVYIVQAGDTLSRIATIYNVTVDALVQLNGIVNPNLIRTGQQLLVPGIPTPIPPTPQPPAPQPRTHVVQTGENLFRIALRYGVRWDVLARLNGIINPNRIFIGQVLLIP